MNSNNHNINMERAILSSIIFEPAQIDQIKDQIKPNDFFHPFHQELYSVILQLNSEELPIDEEFTRDKLLKTNKWDEVLMLEVLSSNPISNTNAYISKIIEHSQKRTLDRKVREIAAIQNPREQLEQLEILAKDAPNAFNDDIFDAEDINDVDEKEPEFILADWLPFPKNALSMVVGKGGDGKSFLLIQAVLRYCINKPKKKALAWLSEDTKGISKFRATRIAKEILHHNIKDIKGFNIIGSDSKSQPFHIVAGDRELSISEKWYKFKIQFKNHDLIVLDPLIAFFGGDENNNTQARVFTTLLNAWASSEEKTVIIIHHSSKSKEEVIQRGAGAFRDAVRLNYTIEADPDNDQHRLIQLEKDNWGVKLKIDMNKDKKISRLVFPRALNFQVIEHDKEGIPISSFNYKN